MRILPRGDILSRARDLYRKKSLSYVLFRGVVQVYLIMEFNFLAIPEAYIRWRRSGRWYEFNGDKYNYYYARYNRTWTNERSVEIPIIWKIVMDNAAKRILEVGNVLSWYHPCTHDILDKYEEARQVINCDAIDFKPSERYDLIISISTLEHVGFDPPEDIDQKKILRVLENLRRNCLTARGEIVVTWGLGQNVAMDEMLYEGKLGFNRSFYLKRISKYKWVETNMDDARNSRYGFPLKGANAIAIGFMER